MGRSPRLWVSPVLLVLLLSLSVVAGPRSAAAHAEPDAAVPAMGTVVATAPKVVKVHFSEEANPIFTVLTVVDAAGTRVDQGNSAVDLSDPERRWVTVSLRPDLGDGGYTVRWLTRSFVDGHRTEGSVTFTIETPAATPSSSDRTGGIPAADATPRLILPPHVEPEAPASVVPPAELLISLGVGLGAAAGIWLVGGWFARLRGCLERGRLVMIAGSLAQIGVPRCPDEPIPLT
ncbi:MAG: copper resistance protein CopC [Chloroflexota bacterium]|nr:copper resistance protein CopC [Chloroflexota bacterium]